MCYFVAGMFGVLREYFNHLTYQTENTGKIHEANNIFISTLEQAVRSFN